MLVAAAGAGCGGGEGVAEGATVTAYVEAPLCAEAERELAHEHGRAGDIHLRAVCLPSARERDGLDLATVGASARRASEDSTTVAYIAGPDPAAARFSHPILEEAGIAQITSGSGSAAMAALLRAVRRSGGSGSLRESVRDELH